MPGMSGLVCSASLGRFAMPERDSYRMNTVGEPCEGEPHARFDEGRLGRLRPNQLPTLPPNWNAAVWGDMYQHRAANPCWRKKWPTKQAYLRAWSTQPPGINPEVGGPLTLVATTTVKPGEVAVRVKQPTPTGYVAGWLDQVMAFDGRWAILHWSPAEIDKAEVTTAHSLPAIPYMFEACQKIEYPGSVNPRGGG